MRELRSCEFCGKTGVGAYEVLPATVENGPRRMVLCDDCRTTLESVVDPLLDGQHTTRQADAQSEVDTDDESVNALTSSDNAAGASPDTPDQSASPSVEDAPPEKAADAETHPDTAASDPGQGPEEDGVTILRDDNGQSGAAEHPDTTESAGDDPKDPEDTEDDSGGTESTGNRAGSSSGGGSGARQEEPDGFRRAMRLLNNREFPVDRSEFVALATGAYDMDDSQAEAIIDHAVDRGVLVEDGGQLKRR